MCYSKLNKKQSSAFLELFVLLTVYFRAGPVHCPAGAAAPSRAGPAAAAAPHKSSYNTKYRSNIIPSDQ